ncbi:hypothetical protein BN940_12826 [Castellaniella defragrans 65Phen]|uniref:Uncharacterized protein n=1 Tax=Castellaniella defragrans (strain DSM 12143 / CCUG 39792 / 65Phen) TaxID=1437824 RepID=W8X9L1_CASD6|nr:hypothetical protein BN940_12826 [Castellaniella defragrans 65Phen]
MGLGVGAGLSHGYRKAKYRYKRRILPHPARRTGMRGVSSGGRTLSTPCPRHVFR